MRNLLYFILTMLFVNVCLSQSKAKQTVVPDRLVKLDTLNMKSLRLESDTVYVRSFTTSPSPTKPFLEQNGPWIAALVIGILAALVNLWISWSTRKSTREALEKQLQNSKDALNTQVQTSKEIALAQIENAQKSAERDFNKTVLSGNRQAWINDLRDLISKILAASTIFSIKKNIDHEQYENLRYMITKTQLMLNSNDDKKFISALADLEICILQIMAKTKTYSDLSPLVIEVEDHAKKTLKAEWERVKKGE